MLTQDKISQLPKDEHGVIAAAYVGVDGQTYRVRVPVAKITLVGREGSHVSLGEKEFTKWHDAEWFLNLRSKHAPSNGAYDKFSFEVTWANGDQYEGRYDLSNTGGWHSLQSHIRNNIDYVLNRSPLPIDEEKKERCRFMILALDLGQHAPAIAPEGWESLRDYRTEPVIEGETKFDNILYGLTT